jgi:hypothetical protein
MVWLLADHAGVWYYLSELILRAPLVWLLADHAGVWYYPSEHCARKADCHHFLNIEKHIKLATDEQVFIRQVLFGNCANVCVRTTNFLWQDFGFLTDTITIISYYNNRLVISLTYRSLNMQVLKLLCQIFFVDPYRGTKFVFWQFPPWQTHLFKS